MATTSRSPNDCAQMEEMNDYVELDEMYAYAEIEEMNDYVELEEMYDYAEMEHMPKMSEFHRIPPSDIQIGDQIGRGGLSTEYQDSGTTSWSPVQCMQGPRESPKMAEFLRIPPSDIQIGDQIGRGGFSTVHQASWHGKQCAAKIVQTADVSSIREEVAILSKLSHPNCIGCLGFSVDSFGDPSRCMILMELMDSDLRHLMNERLKNKAENALPFSETEAVDILCQIAAGMEYLHAHRVFHGDLKASNVLVSHGCDGKIHVKITDFGVSQMAKLDPAETSEEFIGKKHFRGAVGTRGYQAPEVSSSSLMISDYGRRVTVTDSYAGPEYFESKSKVVKRKPNVSERESNVLERKSEVFERGSEEFYTAKADMYCFAMTSYEILSGRVPFESVRKPDIPALVLQGARPELPHGLDRRLVALIKKCWDQKPTKRPRFGDILSSLERCSKDQSWKKAPKCWGRLLRRSRRGMWK